VPGTNTELLKPETARSQAKKLLSRRPGDINVD